MAIQDTSIWHPKFFWDLLPKSFRDTINRLWHEALGAVYTLTGIFLLGALASYNVNDPSLNTASTLLPTNWLGWPGAYAADLLMQSFGLGAYFIAFPFLVWGLSLILYGTWPATRQQTWRRLIAWGICILVGASVFGLIATPETWPLRTGLGGLIGSAFASAFLGLLTLFSIPVADMILLGVTASITLISFFYCLGLAPRNFGAVWDTLSLWYFVSKEFVQKLIGPRIKEDQRLRTRTPLPQPSFYQRTWAFFTRKKPDAKRIDPVVRSSDLTDTAKAPKSSPLKRLRRNTEEHDAAERLDATHASNAQIIRSKKVKKGKRESSEAQPTLNLEPFDDYTLPPLSLLAKPKTINTQDEITDDALEQNARMLERVLDDFGVRGEIIRVRPGPVVTLYELEPAAGIKSSRVIGLADDIARSMSAVSARVAVVPGRNVIGIELPNSQREIVFLRELLATPEYERTGSKLALTLGKNIGGEPVVADLATMPHLLIAGTTGSGKSVGINTMILSLLYRLTPNQCKLILIDPKMLELSVYDGIPHLLAPVVTDPKKAVVALKWVVREMEDRYQNMSKLGVRNISGYNARIAEAIESGESLTRTVQTGFDRETGKPIYEQEELTLEHMPFIVVVVDEMADLMMVAGKDIEGAVQRLAQMARAAGIHLITATQRPSVDVITGTIKANFPTRISFQVTSKIDSRTILGEQGSEQLLGQGDMLYMAGGGRIRRVHGPFVSDDEVEKVVRYLKKQGAPEYVEDVTIEPDGDALGGLLGKGDGDELYDEAVQIVARDNKASTSYIQRRLQIGYNRAARIVERMEEEGVISPPNNAGKRDVLVGDHSQY